MTAWLRDRCAFEREYCRYLFWKPWTWAKVWCRLRGHPDGPVFYNVGGLEPDMRCQGCNDYLG